MENLEALKLENKSLRILAEQDSLTGVLNRRKTEERINQALKLHASGVFILLDLDDFRRINSEYGHLTGDKILQDVAKLISYFFTKRDVIGRIGGDKFIVFAPGEYGKDFIRNKIESLQNRVRQAGTDFGLKRGLSFTAGVAFMKTRDNFLHLYERADCALRSGKINGKNGLCFYEASMEPLTAQMTDQDEPLFCIPDMKYIVRELKESEIPDETYCQDYQTFLTIYRFFERLLGRFGLKCHIILFTLTDSSGDYVELEELGVFMEKLRESICCSLRVSDIYSQYSSCQFLVMTPGADLTGIDIIIKRVRDTFSSALPDREDIILSSSFYPLKSSVPARKKRAAKEKQDRKS